MSDANQSETYNALSPPISQGRDAKQLLSRILALSVAVGVTLTLFYLFIFNPVFRDKLETFATYGYPGVFLISFIGNATVILPAPVNFPIVFALARTLPAFWLGLSAGAGSALGEMTGYLAGFGGRGVVEDKKFYRRLEALMRQWGAWVIFILALIPNPFFDVGGILAGTLKIPWWKFLAATIAGKSIRFILIARFGEFFDPYLNLSE